MNTILFDLDGTLTDPKVGITSAVAYALECEGIHIENLDDLCFFIGPPLKQSFIETYHFDEQQVQRAIKNYRVYFERQGMFENKVYPGIVELCDALCKQGKKLIVATSKPTYYAKQIIEHFHLGQYFTDVCGSEMDGTRTKKGEVIAYAIKKHALNYPSCIMVGDRKHDVIGAKNNHMKVIGVLYGYGDYQELQDAQADYIVETVEDLSLILMK